MPPPDDTPRFPPQRPIRLPRRPKAVNLEAAVDRANKRAHGIYNASDIMQENHPKHYNGRLHGAFSGDQQRFDTATFAGGRQTWEDADTPPTPTPPTSVLTRPSYQTEYRDAHTFHPSDVVEELQLQRRLERAWYGNDPVANLRERILEDAARLNLSLGDEALTMSIDDLKNRYFEALNNPSENVLLIDYQLVHDISVSIDEQGYLIFDYSDARRTAMLAYARELSALSRTGTITDLEALARMWDYGATFAYKAPGVGEVSNTQIAADINYALTGVAGGLGGAGYRALFLGVTRQLGLTQEQTSPVQEGLGSIPAFGDSGFHSDYQDGGNQLYHLMPAINSIVQSSNPDIGQYEVYLSNWVHEIWGFPDGPIGGSSREDERLTYAGGAIGLIIINEGLQPYEVGSFLRQHLSSPYPVEDSEGTELTYQFWSLFRRPPQTP